MPAMLVAAVNLACSALFAWALCCTKESVLCSVVYFQPLCRRRLMRKHGDTLCPHSEWSASWIGSPSSKRVWATRCSRECLVVLRCFAGYSRSCFQKEAARFAYLSAQPCCWTNGGPAPPPYKSCFVMQINSNMGAVGAEARCWAENTRQLWLFFVGSPVDGAAKATWYKLLSPQLPPFSVFSFTEVLCHSQEHLYVKSVQMKTLFSFFLPPAVSLPSCVIVLVSALCRKQPLPTHLYFLPFLVLSALMNAAVYMIIVSLTCYCLDTRHHNACWDLTSLGAWRVQSQSIFMPFIGPLWST